MPELPADIPMKTLFNSLWTAGRLAVLSSLLSVTAATAQPTIVSTVPVNGATGVSTTASVVFTFSEAMDTNNTSAVFEDESMGTLLSTTTNWSAGNTVLTCTPAPAFPSGASILWFVEGQNTSSTPLGGTPYGTFTTTGGGTGGGSGTNKYTGFVVGTGTFDDQTSAGAPVPDPTYPYIFLADVSLASNRTALMVTVTLPDTDVSNLTQEFGAPENYDLNNDETNQTTLDDIFSNGNYTFKVTAAASNQEVTINLPASLAQPPSPQIANWAAAQMVDATQPFTLQWDAFAGGTASDLVNVDIGGLFATDSNNSNGLPGTATSVVIPAGILQSNTSYDSTIGFYHYIIATNDSSYTTLAIRESLTQFTLITGAGGGGGTGPLILTNASWNGHELTFNVTSATNQTITVQYNTNLGLASSLWQTLVSTNTGSGVVQVTDSVNTGKSAVFYRAKFGP